MFKLVVLSALVAVAMAAPGLLHAPLAYTAHVGPSVSIPTAVSHSSRTDVHHKGVVTTYTAQAPIVTAVHAAPALIAAPAVHAYATRTVVAAPVHAGYAAHYVHAAPFVHAPVAHAVSAYSHGVVAAHPVAYAHHY